ncbi:MAG: hypothetical protein ABI539_01295, partial [Acidobacteriota bacterium]
MSSENSSDTKPIQIGRVKPDPVPGTFVDPVCGMTVTPTSAAAKYDLGGNTYYFLGEVSKVATPW